MIFFYIDSVAGGSARNDQGNVHQLCTAISVTDKIKINELTDKSINSDKEPSFVSILIPNLKRFERSYLKMWSF